MTMKRVALMLTLMMLVGTLSSPLLSEFHDEVPVVLDVEDADVMNAGRGSGYEYVDIDHSGYVYEHPNGTEVWASGSDVYVEFTSGNLAVGENYQLIWNLSYSTSNWGHETGHYDWNLSWNATSNTSVENSTISGLADGVYYFHATLVNQGSHVATDMTMIQVGNSSVPSPCTHLDVLPRTEADDPSQMSPWTPDPNGDGNRSVWTYGVDIFNAYAHHTCLDAGMYDWNFSLYDANGYMPNFYEDGTFEIHEDEAGSHYDFRVRNFEATDLPVGQYTWWFGISNYTMGISEWAHHNFTVLGNTTDPVDPTHLDCAGHAESRLGGRKRPAGRAVRGVPDKNVW